MNFVPRKRSSIPIEDIGARVLAKAHDEPTIKAGLASSPLTFRQTDYFLNKYREEGKDYNPTSRVAVPLAVWVGFDIYYADENMQPDWERMWDDFYTVKDARMLTYRQLDTITGIPKATFVGIMNRMRKKQDLLYCTFMILEDFLVSDMLDGDLQPVSYKHAHRNRVRGFHD